MKPREQQPSRDLRNMEVVDDILVSGSAIDRKALQAFHELSDKEMERLVYYAQMRHELHEQSEQALEHRKRDNPTATQEELDLGIYLEAIEPQVRNAVRTLRRKGYPTYESGFYSAGEVQTIGLERSLLEEFQLPTELQNDKRIVEWDIKPDSISFQPNANLTIEELTKIWNQIAESLPDRGEPAQPSQVQGAISFREQQEAYQ